MTYSKSKQVKTDKKLRESLTRVDKSVQTEVASRASLFRWVITFGAVAVAALLLSIVFIVVGTL